MKSDNRCPFCGDNCGKRTSMAGKDIYIECKSGFKCKIHNSILSAKDDREIRKRYHQMYFFMKKTPYIADNANIYRYYFFYNENLEDKEIDTSGTFNVAKLMKSYPKTFMDKMGKAIYNLSKAYPTYGAIIPIENFEMFHLLYCEGVEDENDEEKIGILNILFELGYLSKMETGYYYISAKGWEKVSEIERTESNNQGFIAMSFSTETSSISTSFEKAINRCGYIPRRIDEKEHNNQIVPEILFEISRSKFVVVDVTYPNYGAYYEAGYAEALGKEVIICCRDKEFCGSGKPHFDIAQKSSIVWKDEEDLENRLYKRIEATVGLNN